jgi:endonuclease/exonuclease/phosphatase family metal-dependent hydrolase
MAPDGGLVESGRVDGLVSVLLASYNIHFGVGADGISDLERIAAEVDQADIICLQEVAQYVVDDTDQFQGLVGTLERFGVYGSTLDVAGPADHLTARGRFGNAVLSRWPILTTRTIPLPAPPLADVFDPARCAVEAVIDAPDGPLRVASVHLSHLSPERRLGQVARLLEEFEQSPTAALAWSGRNALADGRPAPLVPVGGIMCGDFNMEPGEAGYELIVGEWMEGVGRLTRAAGLVDAFANEADRTPTYVGMADSADTPLVIDHIFHTTDLGVEEAWVANTATGSDHLPVFVRL